MDTIYGKNIYLRPLEMNDTDLIIKWRNTDFVRNNFIFREEVTREMHLNWISTKVNTGKVVQFIAFLNDNTPIGSVYFRDIDKDNKSAEFGIFIGEKSFLGRGYGSEIVALFIEYGLGKLGLKKIILRVIESNSQAINIYEKVGFKSINKGVEISHPSGEKVDTIYMELTLL